MDFAEPEEHQALRAAVADIAAKFGPRYYAEHAAARRPCAELWRALGEAGFIGVSIPEEYGGGGGGLTELALVCEEIAAAGTPWSCCQAACLVISAASSVSILALASGWETPWWAPIGSLQTLRSVAYLAAAPSE